MITGIDHIVIVVPALDEAIARYQALGFEVRPGGRHSTGTHNALIALEDGSYLELLAFLEPQPQHRWSKTLSHGGGFADLCIMSDNIDDDVAQFAAAGAPLAEPKPMSRIRPDGRELQWRLSIPLLPLGEPVPFLIEDLTPRVERVPPPGNHRNGVKGIAGIRLVTDDLGTARARFTGIFKQVGRAIESAKLAAEGVSFMLGDTALHVMAPASANGPLAEWLATHGPSPYSLALSVDGTRSAEWDMRATGGVRVELQAISVSAP